MKIVQRHNGWIVAAAAVLSALACPVTGAAAENGRFEKLSVYLERMYRIMMPRCGSRPPARRMGWPR